MTLPETFLTLIKPGRRPITAAKRKPKGKKKRKKKFKSRKAHAWAKMF